MCFWCYFYLIFFALFFFVQLFGEAFDVASDFWVAENCSQEKCFVKKFSPNKSFVDFMEKNKVVQIVL